jgi:hypothetical protein
MVLNYSFLKAHLWESAFAEHWSLLKARNYHQKSSNFDIRLPDSGYDNRRWILAKQARIRRCRNLALVRWNSATFSHRR